MSRPWMPLYVADYLADTGHLSAAEHGAYLMLIMHYWANGGLPEDEKKLARIARMSPDEWSDARDTLQDFFEAGWRHKRIDKELSDATAAYERRAAAGRKAHSKSTEAAKPEQCSSNADAMPQQPQPQPQLQTNHIAEQPVPAAPAAAAEKKIDLDQIERRLRDASGAEASPNPALCDLSSILGLIDQGADLETEILPAIRAKPNKSVRSWGYFVPQIQEFRARRVAAASGELPEIRGSPAGANGGYDAAAAIAEARRRSAEKAAKQAGKLT